MSYIVNKPFLSAAVGDRFQSEEGGKFYRLDSYRYSDELTDGNTIIIKSGGKLMGFLVECNFIIALDGNNDANDANDDADTDHGYCLYDKVMEFVDKMADQYREDLKEAENEPSKVVQLEKRTVLTNMLRLISEIKSIA